MGIGARRGHELELLHCEDLAPREPRELRRGDDRDGHHRVAEPLAEALASSFAKMRGVPNVPWLFASFGVIRMTQMPAVTVEMGYLTNAEEARLFKSEQFKDKCAGAILNGLIQYVSG